MASSSSSSSSSFIQTGGKKKTYHCSYCKRDITLQLRIHCAVCENFELCGDCFSTGVNCYPHESNHDYRVVDCLDVPIFTKDWTIAEELLLLEGIDRFGVGNWKNIGDYIGSKNTKQVEEHYWEVYMGVHGYCLPTKTILQDEGNESTLVLTESLMPPAPTADGWKSDGFPTNDKDYYRIPVVAGYTRDEEVIRDAKGLQKDHDKAAATASSTATTGGRGRAAQHVDVTQKNALLPGSDLPGFIPLREDFDVEHENDAEALLADMEFGADDHPSERDLKLQVIGIYNNKLDDREKRKRFVIDRGLVDRKEQQALDRRRTKEEKELVARLRVFARFHSAADHEALVDGILRARKLRQQIEVYQLYRTMGIRTLEQAKLYEAERKRRENEIKSRKQRSETPYLYETGRTQLSTTNRGGTGTSASSSSSTVTAVVAGRGRPPNRRGRDDENTDSVEFVELPAKNARRDRKGEEATDTDPDALTAADIAKAPNASMLSDKELQLCKAVPMLPSHYLAAKEAVVREAYRNGTLNHEGVHRVLKLEGSKMNKVADFFVREMATAIPVVPTVIFSSMDKEKSSSSSAGGTGSSSSASGQGLGSEEGPGGGSSGRGGRGGRGTGRGRGGRGRGRGSQSRDNDGGDEEGEGDK